MLNGSWQNCVKFTFFTFHLPCLVFPIFFIWFYFHPCTLDHPALFPWLHNRRLSLLPWGCWRPTTHSEAPSVPTLPNSSLLALGHVRDKGIKPAAEGDQKNYRSPPTQTGKYPGKVGGMWRWWKRRNVKEFPGVLQSSKEWSMDWAMHIWANDVNRSVLLEEKPEDYCGFLRLK